MSTDPSSPCTRRKFLRNVAAFGAAGLTGLLAGGCGEEGGDAQRDGDEQTSTGTNSPLGSGETSADCRGTTSLSQHSREVRQALDYTPETPIPAERCDNCRFYEPPRGASCGGCEHFSGPVTAGGWCTVWDPQLDFGHLNARRETAVVR